MTTASMAPVKRTADDLTSRENFWRMMERRQPEWLPLDMHFTAPVVDLLKQQIALGNLPDVWGRTDFEYIWWTVQTDPTQWRRAFSHLGVELPANAEIGAAGVTMIPPRTGSMGAASHMRHWAHPLQTVTSVDQLRALPFEDLESVTIPHLGDRVSAIHERGRVAVGPMECTVFEQAWYLRGMDNLYMDLVDGNDVGQWLLDWFMNRSIHLAKLYAEAGVDVIRLGDDVGTQRGMMMATDFWREHLKPRLQKVIQTIRAHQRGPTMIFYHSDGDIRPIIGDLADIGVNILNPVQPECMPVDEILPAYQDRLAFWGMVGTQTTMPFGSEQDVKSVVEQLANHARRGVRIVVAPTHVLEPDVPWQNLRALFEAVDDTDLRNT